MDKKLLVDAVIKEGSEFVVKLDESGLNVSSAFWYYLSDLEEWRLILATPLVDREGPKKTYAKIQKILHKNADSIHIPFEVISVISPKNELNLSLRSEIKTGNGISNIRYSGNVVNGILIQDALLYRIN